jgi:hypothetical protein
MPDFFFSCFFFNPARFQPRVDLSGWAEFQNYEKMFVILFSAMKDIV